MQYSIKRSKSGMWHVMDGEEIVWVSLIKSEALLQCKKMAKTLKKRQSESLTYINDLAKKAILDEPEYIVIRKNKGASNAK